MKTRSKSHANIVGKLQMLVSGVFIYNATRHLQQLQNMFLKNVISRTLKVEYDLWKRK